MPANNYNQQGLTPQEEAFAREVAYMMLGSDLSRLGVDVRYELKLYLAYKKAYPNTNASVTSLYVMSSRLYKKAKIRLRIEELTKAFEDAIIAATADDVKRWLNRLRSVTSTDYYILDQETGAMRLRKEYELSTDAWWLVKKMYKYGYEKMTAAEIIDMLAKFEGWYKAQESNVNLTSSPSFANTGFLFDNAQ